MHLNGCKGRDCKVSPVDSALRSLQMIQVIGIAQPGSAFTQLRQRRLSPTSRCQSREQGKKKDSLYTAALRCQACEMSSILGGNSRHIMQVEQTNQWSNQSWFECKRGGKKRRRNSWSVPTIQQYSSLTTSCSAGQFYPIAWRSFKMMEALEIVALFLGFSSWILILVSLQDQYWKESTTDGSVITTSTIYENLWMSCASDSTGIYNCRDFPSLFALPGRNQRNAIIIQELKPFFFFFFFLFFKFIYDRKLFPFIFMSIIKQTNVWIHFVGAIQGIYIQKLQTFTMQIYNNK